MELKQHPVGFLQIDPLPSQLEINQYYEAQYYQNSTSTTYQQHYSPDELSFIDTKIAQKYEIVSSRRPLPGNFLDIGCGEGFVLAFFAKRGWSVEGIDFSDFGIKAFNSEMLANFKKGDIYKILENKIALGLKYDVLWLGNVLEHVLDPIELLLKLKELLSPNGCLVITVPNDSSKYQSMLLNENYVDKKWWIVQPDHLSYFNYDSLKKTCEYSGFETYQILGDFPIDFFLLHSGSNYVNNKSLGKEAHKARVRMENFLSELPISDINSFYSQLAKIGLGRDLTVFLTK